MSSWFGYARLFAAVCLLLSVVPAYSAENTPSNPDYLIIVSSPLYRTGGVADALETYVADVTKEGWQPKIITVNNEEDPQADYICPRPEELKQVIRQYHRDGLKGFLFVGSTPHLPTAFWRITDNADPTDLFYADTSDWGPVQASGCYEPYDKDVINEKLAEMAPEMFWGRVDPMGMCKDMEEAAAKVVHYFEKVHNYRVNGSNLPAKARQRYLLAADCSDYKIYRDITLRTGKIVRNAHFVMDDSLTTAANWQKLLEEGNEFAMLYCHSGPDVHAFNAVYEETSVGGPLWIDQLTKCKPKVHHFILFCCSGCKYADVEKGPLRNLGATYLFENDYTLGVNGSSGTWGLMPSKEFYGRVGDGMPIGESFRLWFCDWMADGQQGCPKGMMLGDPVLRYQLEPVKNRYPFVMSHLAGPRESPRVEAVVGEPFGIQAVDWDYDDIVMELHGLPEGAAVQRQNGCISWTPTEADADKTYHLQVKARNVDSRQNVTNEYVEEFTIKVRRAEPIELVNADFELTEDGVLQGWQREVHGWGDVKLDSSITHSGGQSIAIDLPTPGIGKVYQEVSVKPLTRYALVGYVRCDDVKGGFEDFEMAGAHLKVNDEGSHQAITTTYGQWIPIMVIGRSGTEPTMRIECAVGGMWDQKFTAVGKVWFDDLRLYEVSDPAPINLGFEEIDGTRPIGWGPEHADTDKGGAVVSDDAVCRSGSRSLRLESNDEVKWVKARQRIYVRPNKRYRVSGYVKLQGVTGKFGARLVVNGFPPTENLVGDSDWQKVSLEFDNVDKPFVQLECRLGDYHEGSAGTAWFDDIEIEEIGDAQPKVEENATTCPTGGCQ